MQKRLNWRIAFGAILLFISAGVLGCAQDVGDIDRTQPEKIDKEIFLGDDEWYMQNTIIDTSMEMGLKAFETDLKRVRWTITRDFLYAHTTVELAEGLRDGFDDEDARRGGVVAAYPIIDHFDVQRQYSSQTGEPTNVIVENRSDRDWYERDYMRVDWSINLVDQRLAIDFPLMFGNFMPVAGQEIHEQDREVHPYRHRITEDYIDVTAEWIYEPNMMACFGAYGLDAAWSCEGGRVTLRTSMKPVPEEETYEPMNYVDGDVMTRDGTQGGEPMETAMIYDPDLGHQIEVECTQDVRNWLMQRFGDDGSSRCRQARFDYGSRFGYFRTERIAWDRYTGGVDANRKHYVNRWNIWQTMLDDNGQKLAMEERTPEPIIYHLNMEYPEFMFDAAQDTAQEWSEVFRDSVKLAQGIDDDELDAVLEEEYGHTEMFRIVENSCHPGPLVEWLQEYGNEQPDDLRNPIAILADYAGTTATDETTEQILWDLTNEARRNMCAEMEWATEQRAEDQRFTWEQLGDLRYSFFNWVEEDVFWAGYGPSAADPKTGEIIRANANFAGQYIRQAATYAADVVQYFNNELTESDVVHGVQIRDDLFNRDRDSERFGLSAEAQREMSMRAGVDPAEASATEFAERPDVEDLDEFILSHGVDRIQQEADIVAEHAAKNGQRDTRMIEFLERPDVKSFMLGSTEASLAVEAMAGNRFGAEYDEEQFHQAYLDFHNPRKLYERQQNAEHELAKHNVMLPSALEQAAEQLVTYDGVADYFSGADREDIIEHFMEGMFIGTQLHEIGHTVGLRHNFSGHADALNYHDEFWDIERAVIEGDITREEAYSLQGSDAADILGADHEYGSQAEFKLSTVMDYTADMTGRFAGLGKYDEAAIHFAYAEMIEQWDEDVYLPSTLDYESWITDYQDMPLLFADDDLEGEAAYLQGIDRIQNGRTYVPIDEARQQHRENVLSNTDGWKEFGFDSTTHPYVDPNIEYEYCSDEFRGLRIDCEAWIYGANQEEVVNHGFDTFRAFQPFWRHRRHHVDAGYQNFNRYLGRLFQTFAVTHEPFRYYSIYRWFDLGDYTEDLQRASIDGFNFYSEIFGMPESGRYCRYDSELASVDEHWFHDLEDTYVPASYHSSRGDCDDYLDVPRGTGYPYNFQMSDEYSYRIDRVGSYIDKVAASLGIFDISAEFAESAFFTDFRATNISYWTVFKDEMLDMLGGVLLGDYKNFGATVNGGKINYPTPVDPDTWGMDAEPDYADKPRIFTPQSVNHEMNMLAGGLIYNSGWEDREVDFTHYVKVAAVNDESQPFADGIPIVEFVHPVTGQIYQAADIEQRSVAARMIRRANELADRFEEAQEILDGLEPGTSEYGQARSVRDHRREQLQDVVAKMDMSRWAIEGTYSLR